MQKTLFICIFIIQSNVLLSQWQKITSLGSQINCIETYNNVMYAGTTAGHVYISTDLGNTWILKLQIGAPIANFSFYSPDVYAATYNGLYKTVDSGNNWQLVGLLGKKVDRLLIKDNYLFAGTWGDGMFISYNNGLNWSASNSGLTDLVIRDFQIIDQTIIAATDKPSDCGIFISENNCQNWTELNPFPGLTVYEMNITGFELIATAWDGLWKSIDKGINWSNIWNSQETISLSIFDNYWFVASGHQVYYSDDLGVNFFDINNGNSETARSVGKCADNIFLGTEEGGLWRRNLNELSDVRYLKNDSEFRVFPNPVKTTFNLLNIQADCVVSICDIQGKVFYEYNYKPNEEIDIKDIPSGVYFLTVSCSEFIYKQKIIKL